MAPSFREFCGTRWGYGSPESYVVLLKPGCRSTPEIVQSPEPGCVDLTMERRESVFYCKGEDGSKSP